MLKITFYFNFCVNISACLTIIHDILVCTHIFSLTHTHAYICFFFFFLSGSCTIENLGSLTPLSDTWDMLLPVGFRYEKNFFFFFFLSISWNCSLHFNICVKTKIVISVDKCQSNCFISSYCVITFRIEILKVIF